MDSNTKTQSKNKKHTPNAKSTHTKAEGVNKVGKTKVSVDQSQVSMNTPISNNFISKLRERVNAFKTSYSRKEVGRVVFSGDGVVHIEGLQHCKYGEMLEIDGHLQAIALSIKEDQIGAIVLAEENMVSHGALVHSTGSIVEIPVGEQLLGRVVDPLGNPLDGLVDINTGKTRPIEAAAPQIIDRSKVNTPLYTGIMYIDSMIPIGRGQRQLILGDRHTGKTSIAIDTILNQKGKDVVCVYVSIGQKATSVSWIMHLLLEAGAMEYTTIVCSTASDSAPIQYIAPYAGCAIAEEFMYSGKDVLVVYDDLTKHAVAYRSMSLLLKRPAGREAYPGDVFYLHSRLLERSAKLKPELGGGSMTALPIIETLSNNLSFIPSNVVSITDGQIFLDPELFNAGFLPAINAGLSVSRVGSSAQISAMKKVSGKLRLDLTQYKENEIFSKFSSDLDINTKMILDNGKALVELLKQDLHGTLTVEKQICLLYLNLKGMLKNIPLHKLSEFKKSFLQFIDSSYADILNSISTNKELDFDMSIKLDAAVKQFLEFYFES
ncbi:MAG: F0F1 ATP synthase subunit alpha [Clostridiales bacterium]|jgi:F-type H+-transporting ATPase subunit alpha|nr:F0F1 ATP synthase subunit alpha [Clostridiales bacterium]